MCIACMQKCLLSNNFHNNIFPIFAETQHSGCAVSPVLFFRYSSSPIILHEGYHAVP